MKKVALLLVLVLGCAGGLLAEAAGDRVSVAFSDPSRPGQVKINLVNGGITVKGYNGKEVIVETNVRDESGHQRSRERSAPPAGMRRVPVNSAGLTVEEENNVVRVNTDSWARTTDVLVQVPFKTSLYLRAVNDGNIDVSDVDGELDIDNVNGAVTLNHVSGAVVAHALNGALKVTMARVDNKPMAFSSLNGNIDVTLPASTKANVSMRTEQGEVYSDFDINLQATAPQQMVDDGRGRGGKYRVKVDHTSRGTINGGGPEMTFKNFNGDIYIRKGS